MKTYKKSNCAEVNSINIEVKNTAKEIRFDDWVEKITEKEAFICLKDHKPNFDNHPTCRLISPSKSELGHVTKIILNRVVNCVVKKTEVNLLKNTHEVLKLSWNFPGKDQVSFISFDIIEFYPSITKELLKKSYPICQEIHRDTRQ